MPNKKIKSAILIFFTLFIGIMFFDLEDNFARAEVDDAQCQALVQAIENNDNEALQELIAAGIDLNQKCVGNIDIVKNAKVLITPLVLAVENQNTEIVETLINAGASVNGTIEIFGKTTRTEIPLKNKDGTRTEYPDHFVYDPLCAAVLNDNIELAGLLLTNGADPNRIYGTSKLHGFGRYYALKFAMLRKNSEMASLLIENGAKDIDSLEDHYHRVLSHFIETGAPIADIEQLLQLKININSVYMASKWDPPYTLLMKAVEDADVPTVELLLKHGATFDDLPYYNIDYHSDMVLHQPFYFMAARNPDVEMVRFLKAKGIKPDNKNWKWEPSPLYRAASNRNPEVLVELLALGYDPNAASYLDNKTALHNAASANKPVSVKLLIQAGANVNIRTDHDEAFREGRLTPLMCALMNKKADSDDQLAVVKLLLENGAQTRYKNDRGETVLELAENGNPRIKQLISSYHIKNLVFYWLKWLGCVIIIALLLVGFYKRRARLQKQRSDRYAPGNKMTIFAGGASLDAINL